MRLRNSTCPAASAPCTWNTCFAMSRPIVVACSMDASFAGSSTPSPWHADAVGGRPPHHPSLIGLTGTPEEVRKLAIAYKAYYAKVEAPDGSDYAIEHTGFIYLIGPDGQYLGFFPPNTAAERLAKIIRQQLPQ